MVMTSLSIKVITGVLAVALLGFGAAAYADPGTFQRVKPHVRAGATSSQQGHSARTRLKARDGGRATEFTHTCNASGDSPEHGECDIEELELICGGEGMSSEDGGGVTCTREPTN
jgi:hypothetical protein